MKNLNTLLPAQAALLVRKEAFWIKVVWISLASALLLLAIGFGCQFKMKDYTALALQNIDATDIDATVEKVFLWFNLFKLFLSFAALGFLVFCAALVRCHSIANLQKSAVGV